MFPAVPEAVKLEEPLLLNVVQSVKDSCPVAAEEAMGKLMVKELVVVLMLKMLPMVPVETVVITLAPRAMVVEVPKRMPLPSPEVKDRSEPKDKSPALMDRVLSPERLPPPCKG